MRRLMLVALLALSGCSLSYVRGNTSIGLPPTPESGGRAPLVITIDGSGPELCSPDDTDPAHACPAKSGPDPR